MTRAKITGVGAYAPKRVLTNADLEKMVDDQRRVDRAAQRHPRAPHRRRERGDVRPGRQGRPAGAGARQPRARGHRVHRRRHHHARHDLPVGRQHRPAPARLPARRLGRPAWPPAPARSTAWSIGAQFIQTGKYQRVLCIGAETLSKITDFTDRGTCILLADAAGAAVLEATDEDRGIIDADLYSDGQYWELLYMPGGGSRHPATAETVAQADALREDEGQRGLQGRRADVRRLRRADPLAQRLHGATT